MIVEVVVVGNEDDNDDNEGAINSVVTTPAFIHPCHRYRHSCWSYSHSNYFGIRPATATIRVVLCSHVAPSTAADGIIIIIIMSVVAFIISIGVTRCIVLRILLSFLFCRNNSHRCYCDFFIIIIIMVIQYYTTIIIIVFCVFYYRYTKVLLCVLLLLS